MINYTVNKKIKLSLGDKKIAKEQYEEHIESVLYYFGKKENVDVSVVIVAYNEGKDLIRNIEHLKTQSNQKFEIILIDNGLDRITKNEIKRYPLLHIEMKSNLGPSAGRNIAALFSNAPILAFVDADGYVDNYFVENVISRMLDEQVIALRGKVLPIEKDTDKRMIPQGYDLGDNVILSFIDAEGCSAFRTRDYLRVGGMEDSLFGHEGVVMGYRMCEFYGYSKDSFVFDPDVILYHDHHNENGKLEKKSERYTILDRHINLKYPFYKQYVKYYADFRRVNIIEISEKERKILEITGNVRNSILSEYSIIDEKKKGMRYSKPALIKEGNKKNFSIIIPCYKLGILLPKAIDSVLAQTLEDIEVIVVDDASPDEETQKVLDEVGEYVQVIRLEENGGVSVARNIGIETAKSEYILCLDADDTIEPTYLEKAKNVFDADEKVGLVSCNVRFFGDRDCSWDPVDKLTIEDALVNSPVHTATCFRKSLHDAGGGYDANLRGYEDWDHWLRIMKQGCSVRVIPEALFNYFVRPGSKVKTSNANAENLVKGIVNNHRDLYEKYVDVVVARKHYMWAMGDIRIATLEAELESCRTHKQLSTTKKCKRAIIRLKKKFIKKPILGQNVDNRM